MIFCKSLTMLHCRVLEGSTDQGSTWNTIDARSSVIFSSRFCRKSFTVDKSYKANVLRYVLWFYIIVWYSRAALCIILATKNKLCSPFARFRFLRVRESSANPRFQIGSIDFYGKNRMVWSQMLICVYKTQQNLVESCSYHGQYVQQISILIILDDCKFRFYSGRGSPASSTMVWHLDFLIIFHLC